MKKNEARMGTRLLPRPPPRPWEAKHSAPQSKNCSAIDRFYKTLLYNVQSLETLGKLEHVNGMTRSVLGKLPGLKSDLVRGREGWQDWGLAQLVQALKLWRDINPCSEESSNDKKRRDRSEKVLSTGAKKHA